MAGLVNYWGAVLGTNELSLLFISLYFVVVFPYLLVCKIVDTRAGWIFLYGSGIPIVMFFAFVPAQAILNCLLLFCFIQPRIGLFLIFLIGPLIHREFVGYIVLALFGLCVRYVWRRLNA